MAYATPSDLRDRYRQGENDEFSTLTDSDLDAYLGAASAEIDSWRPAGVVVNDAAAAVLKDKALTLARLLTYSQVALEDTYPAVREANEVRAWLRALSAGDVAFPGSDAGSDAGSIAPAATTRTITYDADWLASYTL
jgi:phage gp36-like protein